MTRFLFHCSVPDMLDEGIEAAIDRLHGEIGVNGLVVDAVGPERMAFRPRIADSSKIVSHGAAAWFQPTARHYTSTRLRPNTAPAIKSRNELEKIITAAAETDLTVAIRVGPFENATLAARHPGTACVDLFGRPHDARLCPANPDAREFVAAMVEDLTTNFQIDSIELAGADFGPGLYQIQRPIIGLPNEASTSALIGWCFCSACRQRAMDANLDPDAISNELKTLLDSLPSLMPCPESDFAAIVSGNPRLRAFAAIREEIVSSLLRSIRKRASRPLFVRTTSPAIMSAANPHALAEHCDGFVLAPEHSNDRLPLPARLEMHTCPPAWNDSPSLVASVYDATRQRHDAIEFLDYGTTPTPCLEWVRQAIRFARRKQM
ncbi:MAG: hypothetical protein KF841_04920 [Phycisphaerae bacterium]|nr:hypothetical protein [Phycisphaerae bacterium]